MTPPHHHHPRDSPTTTTTDPPPSQTQRRRRRYDSFGMWTMCAALVVVLQATTRTMALTTRKIPSSRSSWTGRRRSSMVPYSQSCGGAVAVGPLHANHKDDDSNDSKDREASQMSSIAEPNELDRLLSPTHGGGPENLREAVTYMQQQQQQQQEAFSVTRSNWDSIFAAIEEVTVNADDEELNPNNNNDSSSSSTTTSFPPRSQPRQDMTDMYAVLRDQHNLQLYGAVSTHNPPAAGRSDLVTPQLLEGSLDLPLSALTPAPTNALLVAGALASVAEIALSAATGLNLNALVLSTLALVGLDRIVLNGAVLESLVKLVSPGLSTKILRHEAGHFLVAYLLGCPVEGVVLSAWAARSDRRFGARQVSAGTSFFDPDLSDQINTTGRVTRSALDRYSVIVMAGIAAEAEEYGQADGGAGDEMALIAFLSRAGWASDKIRTQARWGALQAVWMLRQYRPAYEALVDCLERGGGLGECVHAIEQAGRQHNLPTAANRSPVGWIGQEGGVPVWSTTQPRTPVASTDATATASSSVRHVSTDLSRMNTSTAALPVQHSVDDTETALQVLQEYKTQVAQNLQNIEDKLNELE